MIKNSIVWIRDDFRLQDNPALSFATNNHEFVSAIYIYDKKDFDNIREAQKWWISKSLISLKEFPPKKSQQSSIASSSKEVSKPKITCVAS